MRRVSTPTRRLTETVAEGDKGDATSCTRPLLPPPSARRRGGPPVNNKPTNLRDSDRRVRRSQAPATSTCRFARSVTKFVDASR
jgi:hypothetical protein